MLIRQGSHCEKHAVLAQQQREKHLQAVHARYNQRRDESDGFYKTERWKRLAARYRRLHPICEECDEAPSQITDHIKARKTHPELSLVWSNLRALCRACHNRVGERVGRIENGADPGAPRMPRIGALNRPGEGVAESSGGQPPERRGEPDLRAREIKKSGVARWQASPEWPAGAGSPSRQPRRRSPETPANGR
ncbi:TPA: HNH endonuclease [Pseudomonas aeruginosa]|nr:HNH endonuclease [Pseudomonas aeruginosa]HCI1867859.1 HNH endonuclease [Pseudomonas aeruginosa]